MKARHTPRLSLPLVVACALGCDGRAPDELPPPRDEPAVVSEARSLFPRTVEMHQRIVARSCAPNTGVCHNTSNYPDLSTAGSLLQAVGSWCNLELPDPTQGYDPCERRGDLLLVEGIFASEIAWVEREALNRWRFGLRDPAPRAVVDTNVYFYEELPSAPVLLPAPDWIVRANAAAGAREILVTVEGVAQDPFVENYIDEVLASVIPGDPNRNGVFGAELLASDEEGARVLAPGHIARSYLWGRITGTVPGTRMPLANEDLSDAEYVAIACFIETLGKVQERGALPSPSDDIDYDGCAFARAPVSYSLLP
jgi:hypothetical protein